MCGHISFLTARSADFRTLLARSEKAFGKGRSHSPEGFLGGMLAKVLLISSAWVFTGLSKDFSTVVNGHLRSSTVIYGRQRPTKGFQGRRRI
jgi:hypothetical protein